VLACLQAKYGPKETRARGGDNSDASLSGAEQNGQEAQARNKKKGRKQPGFDDEDAAKVGQLFEQYGAQKGYVDTIHQVMGGRFSRAHLRRQLKSMGLKKGQLTANQARGPSDAGNAAHFFDVTKDSQVIELPAYLIAVVPCMKNVLRQKTP
jgi:hypothetical protein